MAIELAFVRRANEPPRSSGTTAERAISPSMRGMLPSQWCPVAPNSVVPDQHVGTARLQGPAVLGEGVVAGHVEDQVPPLAGAGVVLAGVVDDPVRAQRAQERELARVVDAGDVRAVGLGELDGDGAHSAGRAVDEHPVVRAPRGAGEGC